MEQEPLVSVIIPTLNSGKTLRKCISSIKNQSYSNIEIIIVDCGSDDDTILIAQEMDARVLSIKKASIAAQTNVGIKTSNGSYVYRVDSDVVLDKHLVKEAVYKCEIEGYDGVCIFWLPDETISFWAKVRKMEKECYVGYPNYVGGIKYDKNVLGVRFFKRSVIEEVGYLDEVVPIAGEDYALYNKLAHTNFSFATITAREKHLGEPKKIQDIMRKQYYYGKTVKKLFKETKSNGVKQVSPIRMPLVKNWLTFIQNPVLTIGFIIYEFLVYASALTGCFVSVFVKEN
jgi:glycosyltransferase involved in cell wall biosynthesis